MPKISTRGGMSARGFGFGVQSSAPVPFGCATYTSAGTYTFTVPSGVTKISVVCVGGGQGGGNVWSCFCCTFWGDSGEGGDLAYTNCIPTTPSESLTVVVGSAGAVTTPSGGYDGRGGPGGNSYVSRGATVLIRGGGGYNSASIGAVTYSGGSGIHMATTATFGPSGGGAAGYAGSGGAGVSSGNGNSGTGGAGGSGRAGVSSARLGNSGGGVGLIVQGSSGAGGDATTPGGGGGSGGATASSQNNPGGNYGGGAAGSYNTYTYNRTGGVGGVRIIYGGTGKSYPNNSAP